MHNVDKTKVLVLGAGGMLGNAVFRLFSADQRFTPIGTLRSASKLRFFEHEERNSLIVDVDVTKEDDLVAVFGASRPTLVINCVGIIKQNSASSNPIDTLTINAILPHRLARFCALTGARLVHISTDCVFSGKTGNYAETDYADADDLYGRTKFLGEVDYPNALTLRTSIIGHELDSKNSLIDWFLDQQGSALGYKNAIFSGFPAIEIARIIRDYVIPNAQLKGLFHLSCHPISKYSLLSLVARIYDKNIEIVPDTRVTVNRSLSSVLFSRETGFLPESWDELVSIMHKDFLSYGARFRG